MKTPAQRTSDQETALRPVRICIYGGTDLEKTHANFISTLAYKILDSRSAVIVTGGFHHSKKDPHATSTDVAAFLGAKRYADEKKKVLKNFFEAWIPDPDLDTRPDIKRAVRMSNADGVAIRVMAGRTPLGRRLAMVAGVDVVVTISGRQHTEVVVEQALELGVPVLPIPNANGDSEDLLKKYRKRIAASFNPGALYRCLKKISQAIDSHPEDAAGAVVKLIRTAKVGKCLVLIPYDDVHDRLYKSSIKPAVERHMIPIRLDRLPKSDAIYTNFAGAIQSSSAVIADITTLNKNVMYEIGYSHGRGLTPLIYTRKAHRLTRLPVYLRNLHVRLVSGTTPVKTLIKEYLVSVKTTRKDI
jgi:hypothetical protein